MDAVTYPDQKVVSFITENMVPLRVLFDDVPLSAEFNVKWTPTLVTLDQNGKEHHRTVGFLAPEELIPSLLLGIGKSHFELDRFDDALVVFGRLLADYPKSDVVPEAVYLKGVSRFKSTHRPEPLKEAYEYLTAKYPLNEWTKRAAPYRLL